jgi:hypothetical protein
MTIQRPMWAQWKRLSRFHNVTAYVLSEEERRSNAFPVVDRPRIQLAGAPFNRGFKLKLSEYDTTLADRSILSSMALVFSWALFETHCLSILFEVKAKGLFADWKDEYLNSIEQWGPLLLTAQKTSWADVLGGEAAIVEAATLRNAIAHGQTVVSQTMFNRLTSKGMVTSWKVGDPVAIDFQRCEAIRASLKSYARLVEAKPKTAKPAKIRKIRQSQRTRVAVAHL